MSPALAHGCPYTPPPALPCKPRVRAGLYTPRGSPQRERPPTHQWKHHAPRWLLTLPRSGYARARAEALCFALVINKLGWPHGRINLREPPGSVTSLTALHSLRKVA